MDDDDDSDDHQEGREVPPPVSRLDRGGTRRNRVLRRASDRYRARDRFPRQRRPLRIEELIGSLIRHHGLTDEVRQRFVCLHWTEIAGERIASKTWPVSFSEGILRVSVITSSWVHEMQFFKAKLVAQINAWIGANRVWLGPPPLVTDIRFVLEERKREPLVDRAHAHRLRLRHWRRLRRPLAAARPMVSPADRAEILAEARLVEDPEVRKAIEDVRLKWNC